MRRPRSMIGRKEFSQEESSRQECSSLVLPKKKLVLRKKVKVIESGVEKFLYPTLVRRLAMKGCTTDEISSIVGCETETIYKRSELREARITGVNLLKMSLRHKQVQIALKGNTQMLIWLGKQYLDQRDSPKDVNTDGKQPIKININFVKARLQEECDQDQQSHKLLQDTSIIVN